MKHCVIFGTGLLSKLMYEHLERHTDYRVEAFTIDREFIKEPRFLLKPLVPFDTVKEHYSPIYCDMLVATGYTAIGGKKGLPNSLRAERFLQAKVLGYHCLSYIDPLAHVEETATVGENCILFTHVVVNAFARIEDNVVLWGDAHIGHDNIFMQHSFCGSGVNTGGCVTVEPYAVLGMNCTIRNRVRVGYASVVGMGVTLNRDTKPFEVLRFPDPITLSKPSTEVNLEP